MTGTASNSRICLCFDCQNNRTGSKTKQFHPFLCILWKGEALLISVKNHSCQGSRRAKMDKVKFVFSLSRSTGPAHQF
jgi:hypothetical protein